MNTLKDAVRTYTITFGYLHRFWNRLADKNKAPCRWWWPQEYPPISFTAEEWQRQHDEISKSIYLVMLAIVTFSFFCLLSLGSPEIFVLGTKAPIKTPFVDSEIAFSIFHIIGPLILLTFATYMHIFIGYEIILRTPEGKHKLPYLFNMESILARWLSRFLFYWLVPFVLLAFSYTASPRRPDGIVLIIITLTVTAFLVWLQICRYPSNRRGGAYRILWLIEGLLVFAFALQAYKSSSSLLLRPLQLSKANLYARDLRSVDLSRADLTEANLQEANLGAARLRKADFRRAKLRKTLLTTADLREASLEGADLEEAQLGNADLRNAVLRGEATKLKNVTLVFADLREAQLGGTRLEEANLAGADVRKAYFTGAYLTGALLSQANLQEAKLDGVKGLSPELLQQACNAPLALYSPDLLSLLQLPHDHQDRIEKKDLKNYKLVKANLCKAELAQFDLTQANLAQANLTQANLAQANLTQANLAQANLQEANLAQANLQEANLAQANLQEANLRRARLEGVNLQGANLTGADLREALHLTREQLFKVDTLYQAKLDSSLKSQMKKEASHLFKERLEK